MWEAVVKNVYIKVRLFSIAICILIIFQVDLFSQGIWYTQSTGTTEDIHALAMGYRYSFCLVGELCIKVSPHINTYPLCYPLVEIFEEPVGCYIVL